MFSFLKREKTIFLILFVYYIFIVFIAPQTSHYDLKGFFLPWIKSFLETGVQNVYKNPLINYPPITIYVLFGFGYVSKLLNIPLDSSIVYLRQVVFLFDLATFYLFIKMLQRFKLSFITILFFFCNVALIYNTIFWGQLDAIYTFFVVFSIYCALTKRPLLSFFGLLCALASKPQAVIFIPVLVILLFPDF
jgi:Gpi18-like mannosyltransferase